MGSSHSLEDDLIQFKLTSKQMQRSSQKCEKNKQIQKEKMKQAMKSGNIEGAIYSILLSNFLCIRVYSHVSAYFPHSIVHYSFITSIIRQTLVLFHLLTILLSYYLTNLLTHSLRCQNLW